MVAVELCLYYLMMSHAGFAISAANMTFQDFDDFRAGAHRGHGVTAAIEESQLAKSGSPLMPDAAQLASKCGRRCAR